MTQCCAESRGIDWFHGRSTTEQNSRDRWPHAGLLTCRRLGRRPGIKPASGERLGVCTSWSHVSSHCDVLHVLLLGLCPNASYKPTRHSLMVAIYGLCASRENAGEHRKQWPTRKNLMYFIYSFIVSIFKLQGLVGQFSMAQICCFYHGHY